ncbi:MAG: ABC transporter permease [Burkholderiaceae bacterium]
MSRATPVHHEYTSQARESLSPREMLASLVRHRYLLGQLVRRSVRGSFGGSAGGLAWVVAKPLLMMAVYTLVFGFVFKSRFFQNANPHDPLEFALALYVGLAAFTVLADMLGKAPGLVVGNANFVKKVVFPVEMFVVAEFGAALFYFAVGMALFVPLMLLHYGSLPWSALATPVIVAPLFMITLGVSWLVASLGVYLRDIGQIMPIVITVLMFLSPIFFPVDALPAGVQDWVALSPVTWTVEQLRAAFFLGRAPSAAGVAINMAVGLLVMWLGWAWFQKTKRGFADVL